MASDGLYETRRTDTGWSPRVKLPPAVNVNGSEIGAVFSPSGRTLLFSRDTKGPDSGEFFVLREDGAEDWPPACPAAPASLEHFALQAHARRAASTGVPPAMSPASRPANPIAPAGRQPIAPQNPSVTRAPPQYGSPPAPRLRRPRMTPAATPPIPQIQIPLDDMSMHTLGFIAPIAAGSRHGRIPASAPERVPCS